MVFLARVVQWVTASRIQQRRVSCYKLTHIYTDDILEVLDPFKEQTDFRQRPIEHSFAQTTRIMSRGRQNNSEGYISHQKAMLQDVCWLVNSILTPQVPINSDAYLSAGMVDTNRSVTVSDVDALLATCDVPLDFDQQAALRLSTNLRRRRVLSGQYTPVDAMTRNKLQKIAEEPISSVLVIEGSTSQRTILQDAHVEVVNVAQDGQVLILFIMDTAGCGRHRSLSAMHILKSLAFQVLRANVGLHCERSLRHTFVRIGNAVTVQDWLNILVFALMGLRQVYIVINLFSQQYTYDCSAPTEHIFWITALDTMLRQLSQSPNRPVVKILLLGDFQRTRTLVSPTDEPQECPKTVVRLSRYGDQRDLKRRRPQLRRPSKLLKLGRRSSSTPVAAAARSDRTYG